MTEVSNAAPAIPFDRPNALEIAPLYQVLRRTAPLIRVTTPAGDPAWLVIAFDQARKISPTPVRQVPSRAGRGCPTFPRGHCVRSGR